MIGGGANVVQRKTSSLQIAGGWNYNGNGATGIHIAEGVNISGAELNGMSLAGGLNMAKKMYGFQLAGGANVSSTGRGFQLAPINICGTMHGFQLGVINICDTITGVPFGIINIIRKIPPRFRLLYDDAGFLQCAVKSGAKQFYSLFSIGASSSMHRFKWCYGAGLGGSVKTLNGYLAIESVCYNIHHNFKWDDNQQLHIRNVVMYSFEMFPGITLWCGPSVNIGIDWDKDFRRITYMPMMKREFRHTRVTLWPGFQAGIEL